MAPKNDNTRGFHTVLNHSFLDYHCMAMLLYLKNAPWSFSVRLARVSNIVAQHTSVEIFALGPPISVLTQPGCIAIVSTPSLESSMDRFFMAMLRALLEHLYA